MGHFYFYINNGIYVIIQYCSFVGTIYIFAIDLNNAKHIFKRQNLKLKTVQSH